MQLFMVAPMTPLAALADFGGRRYRRFIPFNFLLSLAVPHLHSVLVLGTSNNLSQVSLSPKIIVHQCRCPGDKVIAGVVVTRNKFIAGINDTGDKFSPVLLTPLNSSSPVSLTLVTNIHSRISPRIFEIIQNVSNEILGAWCTLINEKDKNLVSDSL
jgi:hypothetical protein